MAPISAGVPSASSYSSSGSAVSIQGLKTSLSHLNEKSALEASSNRGLSSILPVPVNPSSIQE